MITQKLHFNIFFENRKGSDFLNSCRKTVSSGYVDNLHMYMYMHQYLKSAVIGIPYTRRLETIMVCGCSRSDEFHNAYKLYNNINGNLVFISTCRHILKDDPDYDQ